MYIVDYIGALEVFHSAMLVYTPKRIHFTYPVMRGRTMLAVLDNNYNAGREQATTATGKQGQWTTVGPLRTIL